MTRDPERCRVDVALERSKTRLLAAVSGTAALVLFAATAVAAPFAYVTNAFAPSVSVVDTASNTVSTTVNFPAGSVPFAVAMTPDLRKVYVASEDSTSTCGPATGVYVIDTATNALEASSIAVGCEPTGIAITPDGLRVYVANQFDGTVSVIDTATDSVSDTIKLGNGAPVSAVAITPDGARAYVSGQAGVFVIDTATNTAVGSPIPAGTAPAGIGITPDGKSVYVTDGALPGHGVTVIDVATGQAVNAIVVGNNPSAVAFTPDGKFAYVTNGGIDNGMFTVSVIDTIAEAVVGNPIQVDSFPNSVAITADGKLAYVGNEGGNNVSVIDTASNTVSTTVSGMNSPRGVAVRPLPPGIAVPDVVGQTQPVATTAITGASLTVGSVTMQASATVAPGSVISQNPAAGVLVGAGAPIDLVVSSGVAVPNVVGQTQAAATTAITAAGLAVGSVTQQPSGSVASGTVISQNPAAGTNVAGGSQVNIVVSSGSAGGGGGGGSVDFLTLGALLLLGIISRCNRWRSVSTSSMSYWWDCSGILQLCLRWRRARISRRW